MKITRSAVLPAGVEAAFGIISDQEYQQAKVRAQAEESTATVTQQVGGGIVVRSERNLATAGMPGPVASMAGDTLTITEQQTWRPADDGTRTADLELTVAGVPVVLVGKITLSPAPTGSRLAVDADLTCSVPLFGKKIEKAAMPAVEESIDHELSQLTSRLS